MSEKRKHSRSVHRAAVTFQVGDGPRQEGMCNDVGIGGMFIETLTPAAFGAQVTVFMKLPELKGEAVIKSVVRWTEPDGMGVQFGMMGARETYALTKLIASLPKT
ncbi:MAG TPA: PilZ domain-containing protein [Polyangiaceae bacterium]|nr:PilZ domain-containing protein [Polyangiaceae bacterium]